MPDLAAVANPSSGYYICYENNCYIVGGIKICKKLINKREIITNKMSYFGKI